MRFEIGYLYHVFNQGNNHQLVFYNRENYLFFLKKIKENISPFADIIAWCLMPNHFHLMLFINKLEISVKLNILEEYIKTDKKVQNQNIKPLTFNTAFGIMLRSYSRAINIQENRSGALFKSHTKAECLNDPSGITPSFITGEVTRINVSDPLMQYPQICFNYIHQNPVKARLVASETDWEFSSARDYNGLRNGTLINKEIAGQYITI